MTDRHTSNVHPAGNGEALRLGGDPVGSTTTPEMVHQALRAADMFTWQIHPDSGEIVYTSGVEEILGFIPGRTVTEVLAHIHPDDREAAVAMWRRTLGQHDPFDADYRLVDPRSGATTWLRSRGQLHRDAAGRPAAIVGASQDITARRLAEETLRDRETRLQSALDAVGMGTWEIDLATMDATISTRLAALLAIPPAPARVPLDVWATRLVCEANDRPSDVAAALRDVAARDVPLDLELRLRPPAGGAERWLHVWGMVERDARQEPRRLLGVANDVTEHKEATALLRASQERFHTLFTSIDEGFCVIQVHFDEHGHAVDYVFEEVNPAFVHHTGLQDAVGRRVRDLVPNLEEHWFETYGAVARTGEPIRFTNRSASLNGRWFDVYAFRIGRPEERRVALLFSDITTRIASEERLRRSEERLRRALEIETVGIMFFRLDGTVTDANNAFLRMSGYTRDDLEAGMVRLDTLTPPEWWPTLAQTTAELLAHGRNTPYEKEYQRKDGSRWWGLFAAARLDDDEAVKFVIDITAAKQAEADRARLAAIVASSHDSIIAVDASGHITDWNRGAQELYGYSPEEAVGQPFRMIVPDDHLPEWQSLAERVLGGESIAPFETQRLRKDGRRIDVEVMLSPIRDATRKVVGIAIVARDATRRKRHERAQQDFLAMVSHDLRTPMTVMRAQAQLLNRRKTYDERSVAAILEQTRRMERLVADLQVTAQIEADQLELHRRNVDARDLAVQAAERARSQTTRHRIRLVTPPEPVIGWWDADRIGQVLDNLLSNAIKYSPDPGDIVVRVERTGSEARISVADSGVGIPRDVQARLFERFYRADEDGLASGLGLGLYITQMLVAAHGGRILLESAPGHGSTFTAALPLGTPPEPAP
mgnify:CR=1 FL=1